MNPAARVAQPALTIAVGLVVAVVATAALTGGSSAPLLVRAALLAVTGAAIAAVLGLVTTTALLDADDPRRGRLLDLAAGAAVVWTAGAAGTVFVLYLDVAPPISDVTFGAGLVSFVTDVDVGRAWSLSALLAAVLSPLLVAVRSGTGVAVLGVLAGAAVVPIALQVGSGESIADGRTAAAAGSVALVALGAWVGTLSVAGVLRVPVPWALPVGCFASVALAIGAAVGVLRAAGTGTPAALVGALSVAAAGVVAVVRPGSGRRRGPAQQLLIAVGSGAGIAAWLTRPLPPVAARTTPAEILTGAPLPAAPSVARLLGAWQPDPLWLVVSGALLAGYAAAALRSGGWPLPRSLSWIAGVVVLVWLTSGGAAVYAEVLVSAHLLQHLGLLLVVPLLLAGGAPLRLLAALPSSEAGLRTGILAIPRWRVPAIARPVPAAIGTTAVLLLLYGTGLLRWSVADPVGAELGIIACAGTGALLVGALTAVRSDRRAVIGVAVGLLALESGGALALGLGSSLLLADWFGAMGWGTDALAAQRAAAVPAWAVAAVPTILLLARALRSRHPALARTEEASA